MPRMLSRSKFPPGGGFHVLHPEAGMKQPFVGSFSECVKFEMDFRNKNKSLAAKYGLPLDVASVEAWVDEQNAIRCIHQGWITFVVLDGAPAEAVAAGSKKNWLASVAASVRSGKAAFAAYSAMFGNGGVVSRDVAEKRASVCAGCVQNDVAGGLGSYFVKETAEQIMMILKAIKDLDVQTSYDEQLGVCKACKCPMRAKINVPINVITRHMPEDTWQSLPKENPMCWIRSESGRIAS